MKAAHLFIIMFEVALALFVAGSVAFGQAPTVQAETIQDQAAAGRVFVDGEVTITDTLNLKFASGASVRGEAFGFGWRHGTAIGSVISWKGPADGRPMLLITGSNTELSSFSLSGFYRSQPAQPEKLVGIKIERKFSGLGTGKQWAGPLGLYGMAVGIQCGTPGQPNASNVDNLHWSYLDCSHVRSIYQINQQQSVGHTINAIRANEFVSVFDVNAGGKVTVNYAKIIKGGSFLTVGEPGPGSNNARFNCQSIDVDQIAGADFKLVRSGASDWPGMITFGDVHWSFDDYHEKGEWQTEVPTGCVMRIEGANALQGGALKFCGKEGRETRCTVEGCFFGAGTDPTRRDWGLVHEDSVGPYTLVVRDCWYGDELVNGKVEAN